MYVLTAVPSYARPVAPRGPSFPGSDGDERGLHTLVKNGLLVRSGKRHAHGLVAYAAAGYDHGSDHATTVDAVDEEEQVVGFV